MISATFFFLFSHLGVGMMLALLFISPRSIGSSFFKFASLTAAILLGVTLGFEYLFPSPWRNSHWPVILLIVSAALTVLYNRVVNLDKFGLATVLLIGAILTGLASIVGDSLAFTRLQVIGGWEAPLLVVNHLAATALLGAGMLTMVFGHWYLVVPRLSIEPLALLTKVLMFAIAARVVSIIATFVALQFELPATLGGVLSKLMVDQGIFFWPRVIFGVVVPIVLTWMIWSTVKLKHTQAATGLLYLAVVTLLFGEFFSKFLLFAVHLPL
jgi:hypothetical protein